MNKKMRHSHSRPMHQIIADVEAKSKLLNKEASDESEDSQRFFKLFMQVRKELCEVSPNDSYFLEDAIRIAFDRWHLANKSCGCRKDERTMITFTSDGDYCGGCGKLI